MCVFCCVAIHAHIYVPRNEEVTVFSLLNPLLVHADSHYVMFQVLPRMHRLLFEVFDENRLVSFFFFLVVHNCSVCSLY